MFEERSRSGNMGDNEIMMLRRDINENRQEIMKLKARISELEAKVTGVANPEDTKRLEEKKKGIQRIS